MRKAKQLLGALIAGSVGAYLGKWLWLWMDVRAHPELYAMTSLPWYWQMLPYTLMAAAAVAIEAAAYLLMRWAIKKREQA